MTSIQLKTKYTLASTESLRRRRKTMTKKINGLTTKMKRAKLFRNVTKKR